MYQASDADLAKLDKAFTYHAPKPDQIPRYTEIRNQAKEFAEMLTSNCPQSRELSLSITALENVVMWANAAISRE